LFLGPLIRDELLPDLLDAYEQWSRDHSIDLTSIAFAKEVDPSLTACHAYSHKKMKTAVVDLRGGEDHAFAECSATCRKLIRRARRFEIAVQECDLRPYIDTYLRLSAAIHARSNQRSPLTKRFLLALLDSLGKTGRGLTMKAEVEGRLAAMYIGAHYKDTLYALDGVMDYAFSRFFVNRLMVWHMVSWGCRNEMRFLDLVGANMRRLADYKASYGSQFRYYSNITKAHTIAGRMGVWLREFATARWRRSRDRHPSSEGIPNSATAGDPGDQFRDHIAGMKSSVTLRTAFAPKRGQRAARTTGKARAGELRVTARALPDAPTTAHHDVPPEAGAGCAEPPP
jgi:hypothetical protein